MTGASLARRVRAIVVDDNDDVRMLLRALLERDGRFDVVGEAGDGFEAIERATALQPDLVVLDRQMPGLGGMEALPTIRVNAPAAAVVFYTAHPDPTLRQAALDAGAIDVITKNLVGDEFVTQLTNVLFASGRSQSGSQTDGDSEWPSSWSCATK